MCSPTRWSTSAPLKPVYKDRCHITKYMQTLASFIVLIFHIVWCPFTLKKNISLSTFKLGNVESLKVLIMVAQYSLVLLVVLLCIDSPIDSPTSLENTSPVLLTSQIISNSPLSLGVARKHSEQELLVAINLWHWEIQVKYVFGNLGKALLFGAIPHTWKIEWLLDVNHQCATFSGQCPKPNHLLYQRSSIIGS